MLKKIRLLVFVSLIFLISINLVSAYSVSSNNNPGSAHTAGTGSNATKGTNWGTPSHLQAVRIRIFRGSTVIKDGYYSLASSESGCYSSVTGTLCETSGYDYSSVTSTSGSSCSSSKTLSLGCIVGTNLNYSMYWSGGAKANGTYLDNYLKTSNYGNLKSLLEGMGYNNTNFNDDDVVIVEPVTSVICDGTKYFGTSTALMKQNVSYSGESGNACSGNDGYKGYTFSNVYKNMSIAFKVSTGTFGNSSYTGFGFFKYNVSDVGFELPKYYLDLNGYLDSTIAYNITGYGTADIYIDGKIVANDVSDYYVQWPKGTKYEIKDIKAASGKKYNGVHSGSTSGTLSSDTSVYLSFSTKQGSLKIIKNDSNGSPVLGAKFNIYEGKNCSGKVLYNKKAVPGSLSLSLSSGDYSIKEVENDSRYYEAPDGTCVNVAIKSGETVTKTFINKLSCDGELAYIKENFTGNRQRQELIKIYNNNYPSKNGLLNFSNPSCTEITCTTPSKTAGCLSGTFTSTDISENNLSCYTNKITVGTDTAFCKTTLSAVSAVGSGPFSAKAGQMYINSSTGKATTLTLGMKCYLYADSLNSTITGGNFSDYLPNVQFDGSETNPKYLTRGSNPTITLNRNGSTREYNGSFNVNYYFKKIYSNNGTGETIEANKNDSAPCTNCKFIGYGKISKLTDKFTNKNIPFKFTLKLKTNQNFSSNCKATVTPEIIIDEKPRIVFRTVNTTSNDSFLNPDGSDREAGSNWKGYESIITTNNNSYNKNGATSPKYKIMLTTTTIEAIRNYNKEKNNNYSDYNLTCKPTSVDSNGEPLGTVCISNYLTTLKANYGLKINNSKIRTCFEGRNKTSATCSIE